MTPSASCQQSTQSIKSSMVFFDVAEDDSEEPISEKDKLLLAVNKAICNGIKELPSAQPERDIPVKPTETTNKAWGIPLRQAVCPKCDYYLGHVAFLGDYKGKRITYCETCGQAIDWEGWDYDG